MVEQRVKPDVQFAGSKREQDVAERVLGLMLARGMFMSSNAAIKVPVESLADYLGSQGEKEPRELLEAVVTANADIFVIEDVDGEPFLFTTR